MTPVPAPRWIRIVTVAVGGAALLLSGFCLLAPDLVFGVDAYRLVPRVAIGLLGAMAGGLGVTTVGAAVGGDVAVIRAGVLALLIASALTTPVLIYNIGALNQTDPSGVRALTVAGGVIVGVSLPLLLSLLVLNRLRRTGTVGAAPDAGPASPVRRSAVE